MLRRCRPEPHDAPRGTAARRVSRPVLPLRRALMVVLVTSGLGAPGCPGRSDDVSCTYDGDCAPGYLCELDAGQCVAETAVPRDPCTTPDECRVGETCGASAVCVPGDCTRSGCVDGWQCEVLDGRWTCVNGEFASGGAAGAAGAQGASGSQ